VFRLARFNVLGFIPLQDKQGMAYPGLPVFFSHLAILILLALRELPAGYYIPAADTVILLNTFLMLAKFPFRKPRTIWPFIAVILLGSFIMLYLEFYGSH
jgi:phosphatidylserine synthase